MSIKLGDFTHLHCGAFCCLMLCHTRRIKQSIAIRTRCWFFVQLEEIRRHARTLLSFRIFQIVLALCQMVIADNMTDLKINAVKELFLVKLLQLVINFSFDVAMTSVAHLSRS